MALAEVYILEWGESMHVYTYMLNYSFTRQSYNQNVILLYNHYGLCTY